MALCCDAGPDVRLISLYLDSQTKKAVGQEDVLRVVVEDDDAAGGGSGGGGGAKVFKVTLVYKVCGGRLSRVADGSVLRKVKATLDAGASVRVFLGGVAR
jgi:hypothetical protein